MTGLCEIIKYRAVNAEYKHPIMEIVSKRTLKFNDSGTAEEFHEKFKKGETKLSTDKYLLRVLYKERINQSIGNLRSFTRKD